MSYQVKLAPPWARAGEGFGKGLAEQLPQEMSRGRLAKGLQNFAETSKGKSPMEQFAQLAGIPGITPQMMQTFGDIARSQAQAGAAGAAFPEDTERAPPSPYEEMAPKGMSTSETPSVTTQQPIEETLNPYIPMTQQEKYKRAADVYNNNPALFKHEFENALNFVEQEDAKAHTRSQEIQSKRQKEQDVLNKVKADLQEKFDRLGAKEYVPTNVYEELENKAIEAVKSGRMTEHQAGKEFGKELERIDRDYASLDGLGNWFFSFGNPKNTQGNINALRENFAKRGDLRNFADSLIAKNGLSPEMAYSQAYPVQNDANVMGALRDVKPIYKFKAKEAETSKIVEKIAKRMGKNSSPLAIGMYLRRKGYDPSVFYEYLNNNRDELGLTEVQVNQLGKPQPHFPNKNDLWLMSQMGME